MSNPLHLTLHWSAGNPSQTFDDYHFNIEGDTGAVTQTHSVYSPSSHTWMRNTNNLGIAFDALGPEHVSIKAIETMAKLVAELCCRFNWDIDGTIQLPAFRRLGVPDGPDDRLEATGGDITAPVVADHAFFAEKDGYANERWDIGSRLGDDPKNLYAPVYRKAQWYYGQLKIGKAQFEYKDWF